MENINLFDEENNCLNEPPENSPVKGEKRKGKRKWPIFLSGSSLLIICALFIVLPILIRGMNLVIINPGKVGIAYNKRGKIDPGGHFIVEKKYKGTERRVLMPGWYFYWKTTFFKNIIERPMIKIPQGKIGVLIAQDGRKLAEGTVLAEDDIVDEESGELITMGEKGIRKKILTPGTYPVNTVYFEVEIYDALDIQPGKVGILTRKIGDPPPPGQILVPMQSNSRGIVRDVVEPGVMYLHPYVYKWEVTDAITIPAGKVGVLTRKVGKPPLPGTILVERESDSQGIIKEIMEPGLYYINPYEFQVEIVDAVYIPDGFVGVKIAKTGKTAQGVQVLVEEGFRGVQKQYMKSGLYYLNPYEFDVVLIESRKQKYDLWLPEQIIAEGKEEMMNLSEKDNNPITFLSNDGFKISIDVTVVYEILPEDAPYVMATLGKDLKDIRTKIICPGTRSFARLEGSALKAVEFVTGETRKIFQQKLESQLRENGALSRVNILNAFVRSYTIPEELLEQIKFKEIAQKEKIRIIEEQEKHNEEAKLAKQKIVMEQHIRQIKAETEKKIAETKAHENKRVAIISGEKLLAVAKLERKAANEEKLKQIALGEGEAKRRELLFKADNLEEQRLNAHKEIMLTFASQMGKQKWVPDMIVGGNPENGNFLQSMSDFISMLNLKIANQLRTSGSAKRVAGATE